MSVRPILLGFLAGCLVTSLVVGGAVALRASAARSALGHRAYRLADPASLVSVDPAGGVKLQRAAARAFLQLQQAAKRDGVMLVPVSGFRTIDKQAELFFHGAALKNEPLAARALVCAPPGYSEHHTGYSLDLGDGEHRDSQLEMTFRHTRAFIWMKDNAARFHFEMSFPEDNAQGVAYEPWHWRYVGDVAAFKTFFPARLHFENLGVSHPR